MLFGSCMVWYALLTCWHITKNFSFEARKCIFLVWNFERLLWIQSTQISQWNSFYYFILGEFFCKWYIKGSCYESPWCKIIKKIIIITDEHNYVVIRKKKKKTIKWSPCWELQCVYESFMTFDVDMNQLVLYHKTKPVLTDVTSCKKAPETRIVNLCRLIVIKYGKKKNVITFIVLRRWRTQPSSFNGPILHYYKILNHLTFQLFSWIASSRYS